MLLNALNKSGKQNPGSLGDEIRLKPGVLAEFFYSYLKVLHSRKCLGSEELL